MKKQQEFALRQRVGDLDSLFGIKDYCYNDGPAKGVRAFDLNNGQGLQLTVLADRGLDIAALSFKGVNMAYACKVGVRAPEFYVEENVRGYLKQFFAGMLTTCGITYAGAPCEENGRKLGLHGPYSNTPAEQVCACTNYVADEAVLTLSGSVREACMFGENMRLSRVIAVSTEENRLTVTDHVENLGFAPQPVMLVYHINFGYPMLDAGAKVYTSAQRVTPRDAWAATGPGVYSVIDEPEIGRAEQCYFHTDYAGEGFAMLHNEALGMAGIVTFDPATLPLLCQWKCMMAGEYALGLEPTVAGVMGRAQATADGLVPMLAPGEARDYGFSLRFADDAAEIAQYVARASKP